MNSRIRFFLIHLGVSGAVGACSLSIVFGVWYPEPLHLAVGVTDIFFLLLGVDVIVGPVLTALVYNKSKKRLHFDLATIIVLQVSAFLYGMWTVAEGRPAWLAFSVDRFDLVQVYEIDSRRLAETKAEYRTPGWLGPQWVSAQIPLDIDKRNSITFESVFAGVDIAQRPDLYRPLIDAESSIRQHLHPVEELGNYNSPEVVAQVLRNYPRANGYLPMMARVRPMTVLIDRASAQVVAIVDLNPWQ